MLRRTVLATLSVSGLLALSVAARAGEPAPLPQPVKPAGPVVYDGDAFRSASPYNITTVGRIAPNPQYNRQNFTIPCNNEHQNFDSLIQGGSCCNKNWPHKNCNKCGCNNGTVEHGCGVGNLATMANTYNFWWSGSRSYFGESSREFFERPPSVDAVRHKGNPLPVIYRTDLNK